MANLKSSIRQIRKDAKKRDHHQALLTELRSLDKKLQATGTEDRAKAESVARELVSHWDRAASKGVVPKDRSNRKKARIARFLTKLARSH